MVAMNPNCCISREDCGAFWDDLILGVSNLSVRLENTGFVICRLVLVRRVHNERAMNEEAGILHSPRPMSRAELLRKSR